MKTIRDGLSRLPVLPSLWRNEAAERGGPNCTTKSKSPMSIPSSMVLVHITQVSPLKSKEASAAFLSSGLTDEWCMKTFVSRFLSGSISLSARLLLSTKIRDFFPRTASAAASMRVKKSVSTTNENSFFEGGEGIDTSF